MTSPWSDAPLSIPFSGNTDSTGAFIYSTAVRKAFWSVVKVVAKTQGASTSWEVQQSGAIPLDFGNGPRCSLGPFILGPTDILTVLVASALPNAQVVGQIVGAQYADQASAVAALALSSNPLTVSTISQRLQLYPDGTASGQMGAAPTFPTFTVGANGSVTKTVTIKPTQTNIRIEVVGSTQFRLQIVGHQTGQGYIGSVLVDGNSNFASANSPFRPIDVRIEPTWDPQVDITVSDLSGLGSSVYVSALFGAETTVIAGASTQIPVFIQPGGITATTTDFQTLAGPGTQVVIAGVAGTILKVLGWFGMGDTSAAGARIRIDDTTGLLVADLSGFTTRGVAGYTLPRPKPLTSGAGLRINNPGSGNAVYDLTLYTDT